MRPPLLYPPRARTSRFSGEPVLSGMLKRRSNLTLRLGAPLLVLLRPRSLAAYMPETDAGGPHGGPEAPCVVVPVDDMERVSAVGDGGGGGAWQCQFEVRTRDQVLHRFAAADADARRGWLDALGAMIAEVEKAKGLDAQAALTAPGASGS